MARNQEMVWQNRAHFLAVASQAMRRFLIDYDRYRKSGRRGGHVIKLQIEGLELAQTAETGGAGIQNQRGQFGALTVGGRGGGNPLMETRRERRLRLGHR